jgi:AraC-like DNA-binding protein
MHSEINKPTALKGVAPDTLSEILRDLRIVGGAYCRSALRSPWGLAIPDQHSAVLHFVAEGGAWLRLGDDDWTELRAGDMALLPQGTGHALADAPQRALQPACAIYREAAGGRLSQLSASGTGAATLLFSCVVSVAEPALHPLLELMPPSLVVSVEHAQDRALPALVYTMAEEVAAQRVGAATVLARLADVLIARVIRTWVEHECPNTTGWVAAMRDPRLGLALAAIHRDPGRPWSVETLAAIAGSSRSMFSERFTTMVGMSPGRYLARWRMQVAQSLLRSNALTVSEVAARLGYESEAAFSRAFKRVVGVPPSVLRHSSAALERAA